MLIHVLGAPGTGKTTVTPLLRQRLPEHTILDWDMFMDAASALAGRDIRRAPETWPVYGLLMRATVESIRPRPVVVLGVCTPAELADWPIDAWVLLDCADEQRRHRLAARRADEVADAITDAGEYRALGLSTVDSSGQSPEETAAALAALIVRAGGVE
jgi:broad-specificity NMP kinase